MPPRPPRLVDLHCDWLLQYALDTTVYDPAYYGDITRSLAQSDGYLQGAWASVLACYRDIRDWAGRSDPWQALAELITRIEAEFSGRLLLGPDDFPRWREDADGLCWAVIGVEGFDFLIRESIDLVHLSALFERGVRVFQLVYSSDNQLAGSAYPEDGRGLLDLGRRFLETLAEWPGSTRPILDLAHLNPSSMSDVLDWFEANRERSHRLPPMYSHGAIANGGFDHPRTISVENLRRLRAIGGTVGISVSPPFYGTADILKACIESTAAMPFLGRIGHEGIAIGTDFLGVDRTLPGMENVEALVGWLGKHFEPEVAKQLISGNATTLLERAIGAN